MRGLDGVLRLAFAFGWGPLFWRSPVLCCAAPLTLTCDRLARFTLSHHRLLHEKAKDTPLSPFHMILSCTKKR